MERLGYGILSDNFPNVVEEQESKGLMAEFGVCA
jgi:hypothetical protein